MSAFYRINFQSANNEDLRQVFVLTDDAGAPFDLTGAALHMDIEAFNGADVLEATTANGRIALSDAPAGRFELAVPAATMRTLAPGSYQHDLLLTFADGRVHRVWTGALTLSRGVTE
jgi:hypothetical protein